MSGRLSLFGRGLFRRVADGTLPAEFAPASRRPPTTEQLLLYITARHQYQ